MSRETTDNIERLFSSRLSDAEMEVGDDFWESLNKDVVVARGRRRTLFYRIASCAAVLALLVTTSAAIWFLSPRQEEMKQTFSQIESKAQTPVPFGDFALSSNDESNGAEQFSNGGSKTVVAKAEESAADDDDNDSVFISFTFSISSTMRPGEQPTDNRLAENLWRSGLNKSTYNTTYSATDNDNKRDKLTVGSAPSAWSSKVFVGSALPDGNGFKAPVNAGINVERRIGKHFGVETGLNYTMLRSGDAKQHDLAIPVKLNAHIAESKKVDFYATLGGLVEKCIAGEDGADKKVRAGVTAGVGVNCKLNNRLALFAEPTVTHHFVDKDNVSNIRSQRPTNLNINAGLRITY
jgi:hypothetical protein